MSDAKHVKDPSGSLFSSGRVRVLVYVLAFAGFALFFASVLMNKDSRYNRRIDQMDSRRSNRMSMMRRNYVRSDSIFKEEQKRIRNTEKQQGGAK